MTKMNPIPFNVFANYYYNFGFNIVHISRRNDFFPERDQDSEYVIDHNMKSPTHEWHVLEKERQKLSVLQHFNWPDSCGLGAVLDFENLKALDIDECDDEDIVKEVLNHLGLPTDYEWAVRSGSHNGFHILFFCEKIHWDTLCAFLPKMGYKGKFKHFDLRSYGILVLPPSNHPSGNQYEFINRNFPSHSPKAITTDKIHSLMEKFCTKEPYPEYSHYDISDYTLAKWEDDEDSNYFHSLIKKGYCTPFHLFIDTESTGLFSKAADMSEKVRLVQLAYLFYDGKGRLISDENHILKPDNFIIPEESSKIHGITNEIAFKSGVNKRIVTSEFLRQVRISSVIVGHNIDFDCQVLENEFDGFRENLISKHVICTMKSTAEFCQIGDKVSGFKWPKLSELYFKVFQEEFHGAHNAAKDIKATADVYWELSRKDKDFFVNYLKTQKTQNGNAF